MRVTGSTGFTHVSRDVRMVLFLSLFVLSSIFRVSPPPRFCPLLRLFSPARSFRDSNAPDDWVGKRCFISFNSVLNVRAPQNLFGNRPLQTIREYKSVRNLLRPRKKKTKGLEVGIGKGENKNKRKDFT